MSTKRNMTAKKSTAAKAANRKATVRKATAKKATPKAAKPQSVPATTSGAVLKLLKRKNGASVAEAAKATGAPERAVRSAIDSLRRSGQKVRHLERGRFAA